MAVITERKFSLLSSGQESEEDSWKAWQLSMFGFGVTEMLKFLAEGEELKDNWKGHFKKVKNLLNSALKGEKAVKKFMKRGTFKMADLDDIKALDMFQQLNRFSISHDEEYAQRWGEKLKKVGGYKAHKILLLELRETNLKILEGEKIGNINPEKLADFKSTFESMWDMNMNKSRKPVDRFIVHEPFFKEK